MYILILLTSFSFGFSDIVKEILDYNPFSSDRRYTEPSGELPNGATGKGNYLNGIRLPESLKIGGYVSKGKDKFVLIYLEDKKIYKLVPIGSDLGSFKIIDIEGDRAVMEVKGKSKEIKVIYVKPLNFKSKPKLPAPPSPEKVRNMKNTTKLRR